MDLLVLWLLSLIPTAATIGAGMYWLGRRHQRWADGHGMKRGRTRRITTVGTNDHPDYWRRTYRAYKRRRDIMKEGL